ncbi:MAG: hypothetical protein NXI22_04060 [bacterium]|nr:hypothetical protein [bacterium]
MTTSCYGRDVRCQRLLLTIAAAMSAISLIGCGDSGPPRAAVTGVVTVDGEPLKLGYIRFVPQAPTTGPKVTVPVENGTFTADQSVGPVVGNHRVEIKSTNNGGIAMDDEKALEKLQKTRGKIAVLNIPKEYNDRSELTATILANETNELEFPLQTRRRR